MRTKTTSIDLTDEELLLLDGKCREDAQKKVDAARRRLQMVVELSELSRREAGFVADVVTEAEHKGRLVYRHEQAHFCNVCDQSAEPIRFKSGPRKGEVKKRGTFRAVELGDRFIRVTGSVSLGCCESCWDKVRDYVAEKLSSVRAEVPEKITGHPPKWRRYSNRYCTKCDWRGPEYEMGTSPTLMGSGTYPAKCPKCDATNNLFSITIKVDKGYTIVAA